MRLADVRRWVCQTVGLHLPGAVDTLVESEYDLVVIDPLSTNGSSDDAATFDADRAVARLKGSLTSDGEHRKIVLAYLDIGHAESRSWSMPGSEAPPFVLGRDEDDAPRRYSVAYWDPEWKALLIDGALARILQVGFDGVYLAGGEVIESEKVRSEARRQGKDPSQEMLALLREIASYGEAHSKGFLIVQQNAAALGADHPEHAALVDAIAQEAIWFDGSFTRDWEDPQGYDRETPREDTDTLLGRLEAYTKLGVPVLNLEYAVANAAEAYARSYQSGLVPYVTRRSRSAVTTTPPPGVDRPQPAADWRAREGPAVGSQINALEAAISSYVDGELATDCTGGNYSREDRNCQGSDGNAHRSIASGLGAITPGATLYLRAGTYVENGRTVRPLGRFDTMTTISDYPGERVVWQNDDIYFETLPLEGGAHNVTIRDIRFEGKRYVASNERAWARWQGDVWRTMAPSDPPGEVIEIKSGCDADTMKCSREVRSYLGQEKSSPASLLRDGSDGDFFQDHTSDRVLYVYSSSGDPGRRADLWETGFGITIGNTSSETGTIVVEGCAFDGQGHAHLKGGYRWKVSKNTFSRVGTDWNDHHIYSWSNLSEGNESVYEHNYFENDAGMGAALHLYGTGNQVAGEPPDYHVFRYNLVRGGGFWGV
ncbi:MAG: endo alpha-1,4 polygalactosaminidase, partial [Vicinamibacteria bacterium]